MTWVPMEPAAPGRVSTTTDWFSNLPISLLTNRTAVSLVPPAGCGTTIRIGWSAGQSADAGPAWAQSRPIPRSIGASLSTLDMGSTSWDRYEFQSRNSTDKRQFENPDPLEATAYHWKPGKTPPGL